jgi:hypothetical protein
MTTQNYWTNSSVIALAGNKNPLDVITQKARAIILSFMESGGVGPPFDPFALADYLKVSVTPREDVRDAQTVYRDGKFHIEFNPNRPKGRVRYSVSHEIAHTFFPDCKQQIRHRATHIEMRDDEWQLEMLCNVGAAELLMPIGSSPELQEENPTIDNILEIRARYEVSIEAVLLRFIKLTQNPCAIFSASRIAPEKEIYKIDYSIPSRTFPKKVPSGTILPSNSIVGECTAIGFTAKTTRVQELWHQSLDALRVECVGIPPYPNQTFPRVMGIIQPVKQISTSIKRPVIVKGDATNPRGAGNKILAFVVNDKTPRWGAGFALEIRKKWPFVQDDFIRWATINHEDFTLGNVHSFSIDYNLTVAELICQHGYGDSNKPRIRYSSLKECLDKVSEIALEKEASVHLPRIGSGQARGYWPTILEMIEESLCQHGVDVTIYELPNEKLREEPQLPLFK